MDIFGIKQDLISHFIQVEKSLKKKPKIKVTQYTVNVYTIQYRFWLDNKFLGMKETFLWDVIEYPA